MHSLYFVIIIVALLLAGGIAFGRGGDGAMPAQTRIVLIVSGLAVAALAVWLSMRPGR
jgi:hypothetical protein